MIDHTLRTCILAVLAAVFAFVQAGDAAADASGTGGARSVSASGANAAELVLDAEAVFQGSVSNPRFQEVVATARAILIFPSLLRAGYFIGGESGEGVLLVRDEFDDWSYPAFYQIVGGSFGLQIGVSVTELVLVVRTQRALDRILAGTVDLGGDMAIAIGPQSADASIDSSADVLSFTTSKGLFAGISVDGSTLLETERRNHAYYGAEVSARDIVLGQRVSNPQADGLRDQLVFYVSAIERDQNRAQVPEE